MVNPGWINVYMSYLATAGPDTVDVVQRQLHHLDTNAHKPTHAYECFYVPNADSCFSQHRVFSHVNSLARSVPSPHLYAYP